MFDMSTIRQVSVKTVKEVSAVRDQMLKDGIPVVVWCDEVGNDHNKAMEVAARLVIDYPDDDLTPSKSRHSPT